MQFYSFIILIITLHLLSSCGSNSNAKKSAFSISTNGSYDKKVKMHTIAKNKLLKLSITNPNNIPIDSVVYQYNKTTIGSQTILNDFKLGIQQIKATIYFQGDSTSINQAIQILNDKPPKLFTFDIINEYPHDITSYTQGLEFYNGELYESTGQRGESKLRKVNYKTGEVLKNIALKPQFFGEGLTIKGNRILQLTWQGGKGFIYDRDTFNKLDEFYFEKSKEGWGLCNNGENIYKSDGTEKIWLLNPKSLKETDYIQTYTNKGKIVGINELEWVNGKIFANRYQLDGVAIINPLNGAIEGVIDFRTLKKKVTQHQGLDVLNGLAWNPTSQTLFVTGKRWDKLFEVKIIEQ
ncbi:MAG: glutaminyl-peptide cyclotransferase [Flavobacteriaceae bacterium]|nr:glutaminyl-peptide cyclotransferase [Flavobacteriaceae bacterium]